MIIPNTGTRQHCSLLCWSLTHAVILLLFPHIRIIKRKFLFVDFLSISKLGFKLETLIMRPEFNLNIFHLLDRGRVLRLLVNPKTGQI